MRPQQWPKNALVFAAFVFSLGDAWEPGDRETWWPLLWRSIALFGAWCLAASATYLLNDAQDAERDRSHPRKRGRPIASGRLGERAAVAASIVLTLVAVPAAFLLDSGAGMVVGGYVAVMAAYSLGLKQVAIVDIFILGAGVVGRAVSGALAIGVEISPWLYVCSMFAALFVATSKRWAEFRQLGDEASTHRPALASYTSEMLGHMVLVSASAALISFALYTIESDAVPENGAMATTIPFVAFGMFRYLMLLDGKRQGDAPDQILFTDPQIVVAVAAFVGVAFLVLAVN